MKFQLLELFNTIQGEGSTQGMPVTLIRFQNCNLNCSFCDTANIMKQDTIDVSLQEIFSLSNISRNLLITGGEPTLYINDIIALLKGIYYNSDALSPNKIIIETNGLHLLDLIKAIRPFDFLSYNSSFVYSWSPKLWTEGLFEVQKHLLPMLVGEPNVEIKLVINPRSCEVEKKFIECALGYGFGKDRIWLMPMGARYEELMYNIYPVVQMAHTMGVNLSPRLHILLGSNLDQYLNP